MNELRGWRMNAGIEEALESGACVGPSLVLEPNALPPPWALLVDEVVAAEDDGRTSRQYRDGTGWPYAPYEVIL